MRDTIELLPCPFCSREAVAHEDAGEFAIECVGCGAKTMFRLERSFAVDDWNTRAPRSEPQYASAGGRKQIMALAITTIENTPDDDVRHILARAITDGYAERRPAHVWDDGTQTCHLCGVDFATRKSNECSGPSFGVAQAPEGTKPCAHCRNENLCVEIHTDPYPGMTGFAVRCGFSACGARGPVRVGQMDAVREWNKVHDWYHTPPVAQSAEQTSGQPPATAYATRDAARSEDPGSSPGWGASLPENPASAVRVIAERQGFVLGEQMEAMEEMCEEPVVRSLDDERPTPVPIWFLDEMVRIIREGHPGINVWTVQATRAQWTELVEALPLHAPAAPALSAPAHRFPLGVPRREDLEMLELAGGVAVSLAGLPAAPETGALERCLRRLETFAYLDEERSEVKAARAELQSLRAAPKGARAAMLQACCTALEIEKAEALESARKARVPGDEVYRFYNEKAVHLANAVRSLRSLASETPKDSPDA